MYTSLQEQTFRNFEVIAVDCILPWAGDHRLARRAAQSPADSPLWPQYGQ